MKKITFVSNRPWLQVGSQSQPQPTIKMIPEWYRKADRFVKDPNTGKNWVDPVNGFMPTWKGCPAILDIIGSGYTLLTPCDIKFELKNNKISVSIDDPYYQDFCTPRQPMSQFIHPMGYYEDHFAWFPDWAVEVPNGYSVLYVSPINRFDLPFFTMGGIIDNDKINLPGSMPFFLTKGFEGIIEKGTPYAQMIPFKREDWQSEIRIEDPSILHKKNQDNSDFYRVPNGGVYKNKVWQQRKYI
jgi:hypothetical protein